VNDTLGGSPEPEQPPAGSEDPFNVILDESFVQGAAAKEQSARARELAAKWAKEPPTQTGWRNDTPVNYPVPEAAPKRSRRGKMRVPMRNAAIFVVTAGIAVLVLYPRHHTPAPVNATPAGTAATWLSSGSPSSGVSASPSPSYTNPDDQYFTDSPALNWADNAAGIVPPKAVEVGSFSAARVAAGYASMKQLLAAGDLDATILNGGSTADFTNLLDPTSKLPADLKQWLKSPTFKDDPTYLVSRFNPATTRLLGHIVKVGGAMSASLDKNRDLLIKGDYKFVYAVGPANGDGTASRTVVHRSYEIWFGAPGHYQVPAGKLWIDDYGLNVSNSACYVYNGFFNPVFGTSGGGDPSKVVDPYASGLLSAEPSPTASASPECSTVSRL
jgi:hypothetical protein